MPIKIKKGEGTELLFYYSNMPEKYTTKYKEITTIERACISERV